MTADIELDFGLIREDGTETPTDVLVCNGRDGCKCLVPQAEWEGHVQWHKSLRR